MKTDKKRSNIATLTWSNSHSIDFNNAHVINKGNCHVRKLWNAGIPQLQLVKSDNTSKPLPEQYFIMNPILASYFFSLFLIFLFLYMIKRVKWKKDISFTAHFLQYIF